MTCSAILIIEDSNILLSLFIFFTIDNNLVFPVDIHTDPSYRKTVKLHLSTNITFKVISVSVYSHCFLLIKSDVMILLATYNFTNLICSTAFILNLFDEE